MQIIPAVLPVSEQGYQTDIAKLSAVEALAGNWVHIDLMDNKFVPNQSISPLQISKYPVLFTKEAHLMVQRPKIWIEGLTKAGFKRVLFHLESEGIEECLSNAKKRGLEVGLALKHETPLEKLAPYLSKIDTALLLAVVPGFQGQPFIEGVFDKIKETFQLRSKGNYNFKIGVDGAVKDDNIRRIVAAGADYAVVGSFLLKSDDTRENLQKLIKAINGT